MENRATKCSSVTVKRVYQSFATSGCQGPAEMQAVEFGDWGNVA